MSALNMSVYSVVFDFSVVKLSMRNSHFIHFATFESIFFCSSIFEFLWLKSQAAMFFGRSSALQTQNITVFNFLEKKSQIFKNHISCIMSYLLHAGCHGYPSDPFLFKVHISDCGQAK